jgi:hypothetical protein
MRVDPAALVDVINEAQAQRSAARAELDGVPAPNLLSDAEVYAMVDSLGDVGAAVSDTKEESLANLYTAVDLQVRYEPEANAAEVGIRLGRRLNSVGVRWGTRTRFRGNTDPFRGFMWWTVASAEPEGQLWL